MGRLQKIRDSLLRLGASSSRTQHASEPLRATDIVVVNLSETSSLKQDIRPAPQREVGPEQNADAKPSTEQEIPLSKERQEKEIQRMGACYFHSRMLLPSTVDVDNGVLDVEGDTNRKLCHSHLDRIINHQDGVRIEGVQNTQDSSYWNRCVMCTAASRYGQLEWDASRNMQVSGSLQVGTDANEDEKPSYDLAWLKTKHSRLYSETYKLSAPKESSLITSRSVYDPFTAIQRASAMAKECSKTHSRCPGAQLSELPTRVLELDPNDTSRVRVCETNKKVGQYAALSYCWGTGQQTKLTSNTSQSLQKYFPITQLPKVMEEAVDITTRLGLRYLWVDSLCILQDDNQDKLQEITSMDRIFSGAYITIVAAASPSCDEGIIKLHETPRGYKISLEDTSSSNTRRKGKIYLPNVPENSIATVDFEVVSNEFSYTQPLSRRAWTLQETLLSPRVLVFSYEQITWRCMSHTRMLADRAVTYVMRSGADQIESLETGLNLYDRWGMIVKEYCSRALTYETDRLAGLAGIATQFQRALEDSHYNDTYLTGLWQGQLPGALGWHTLKPSRDSEPEKREYPTWSWASAPLPSSELIYPSSNQDGGCDTTFIPGSAHPPGGNAPASTTTVRTIQLRGRLYFLQWDGSRDIQLARGLEVAAHPDYKDMDVIRPKGESMTPKINGAVRLNLLPRPKVFLLPVSQRYALMLRKPEAEHGCWTRMGVFEAIVGNWAMVEQTSTTETIEIE